MTFGNDGHWDSVIVKAESKDFCFWEDAVDVLFSLVFLLNTMEENLDIICKINISIFWKVELK